MPAQASELGFDRCVVPGAQRREALAIGLVNRVLPADQLFDEALLLAGKVVESVPPGALKAAKLNLLAHSSIDWRRVVESPLDVPKAEWQEGLDAFNQKRAPNYERFWEKVSDGRGIHIEG